MDPWMGYGNTYVPVGQNGGSVTSPIDAFSQSRMSQQGPPNGTGGYQSGAYSPLDMTSAGGNVSPESGFSGQWGSAPGFSGQVLNPNSNAPGLGFYKTPNPQNAFAFNANGLSSLQSSIGSSPWANIQNGFQNQFNNLNAWNNQYGQSNANTFNSIGTGWLTQLPLQTSSGGQGAGSSSQFPLAYSDPTGANTYANNFDYGYLSRQLTGDYQNAYNQYAATGAFGTPGNTSVGPTTNIGGR